MWLPFDEVMDPNLIVNIPVDGLDMDHHGSIQMSLHLSINSAELIRMRMWGTYIQLQPKPPKL